MNKLIAVESIFKHNILVTGKTGAGKSVLLRNVINHLANNFSNAMLYLAVAKTIEFSICKNIVSSVAVSTKEFEEQLKTIKNIIMDRRLSKSVYPKLLLIVDEFVDFILEKPSLIADLTLIAKLGKKFGVYLLFSTQNLDFIKNTNSRFEKLFNVRIYFEDFIFSNQSHKAKLQQYEYIVKKKGLSVSKKEKCEYLSEKEVLDNYSEKLEKKTVNYGYSR